MADAAEAIHDDAFVTKDGGLVAVRAEVGRRWVRCVRSDGLASALLTRLIHAVLRTPWINLRASESV
jgi:hypothetical protein